MNPRKVNIVSLMGEHFGCGPDAARALIAHGGVSIDGHTITIRHAVNHWTEDQLYGRMLKCVRGEARIIGSMLERNYEQMKLR